MAKPPNPSDADRPLPPKSIASYDQYLVTYFPKLQEQRKVQALSPQEFGVSIARHSLDRIKEALANKGAA